MSMAVLSEAGVQLEFDRAREIVATLSLPDEILSVDVTLGKDLYADDALWLNFHVKPKVKPDRLTIKRLTRFTQDVQSKIIEAGVSLFPFTQLEQPD
jgi:hypothetical protein